MKGIYKHKPHSEETKRKISESCKGKISWIKGKKHTEESKKKMSEARFRWLKHE